jgi:hypothetical protein
VSEKEIKVTDKRMFTAEGKLREEYSFLEGAASPGQPAASRPAEAPPPAEPRASASPSSAPATEEPQEWAPSRLEIPGTPPGLGAPTFFDLVAMLAEPAAIYLGDAALPDGSSAENLEMARLHIDLLDVLRQKTAANLTSQEAAFLEDLLYRLRVRYVQKRG